MENQIFIVIAALILGFGLVSGRLQKSIVTPPMVFVAFGMLVSGHALGWVNLDARGEVEETLAELTLILVLFTDAARINLKTLRREFHLPLRLLAIGMPLTILFGALVAFWVCGYLSFWEAAVVAAILAPTDAALGQAVVSNERVPVRIRQALNVESGLNDGIALPVVLVLLALAEMGQQTAPAAYWVRFTMLQVILGPLTGIAIGFIGGRLVQLSTRSHWMNHSFQQLAALAISFLAFFVAEAVGGNGFISAFCAGLTLGNTSRAICQCLYDFAETEGQLLALLTFMVFGAALVWPAVDHLNWRVVLYGVLSLTVIRMVPVAFSLFRAGFQLDTVLFLGWFGPRGLASILFALLVLGRADIRNREEIFTIIIMTVFMSVFAHGLTAWPASKWYGGRAEEMKDEPDMEELAPVTEMPVRIPYR